MDTKSRQQWTAAAGVALVVFGTAALTVILYWVSLWWHALVR